jgi:hypothetical protein
MMRKPIATIILNRNLPLVTDKLVEHIQKYDGDITDIFVVEAGSDKNHLSKYCTWYADWPDALANGLRYSRGMNYGLSQLWADERFKEYEAFFLLTNDSELSSTQTLKPLLQNLKQNRKIGILSPCSKSWGEKLLLEQQQTKFFWFIHNTAYLLRREFVESICNADNPDYMHFLFDGLNFRGYGSESELIAKAYANDWAAAITKEVWVEENESYLIENADIIKTDSYEENIKLYLEEGKHWMKQKYGFNSRWTMLQYVKSFYDSFFEFHPEYKHFQI